MSNAASRAVDFAARRASRRGASQNTWRRFIIRYSPALAAGVCGLVASTMLQRRNEFEERMSNANAHIERLQRAPDAMCEYLVKDAQTFADRLLVTRKELQPQLVREWAVHAKKAALEEEVTGHVKETPQIV